MPVSPQGSRGGLIAAVVIFTVWSVAATIFAIYNSVALSKANDQYQQQESRYSQYLGDVNTPAVTNMFNLKANDPNMRDNTVLGLSLYYNDQLGQTLEKTSGPATNPSGLVADVKSALGDASSKLPDLHMPEDADMVTAISTLSNYAGAQKTQAEKMKSALTESAGSYIATINDDTKKMAAMEGTLTGLKAQTDKAMELAQNAQKTEAAKFDKERAAMDQTRQQLLKQATDANNATVAMQKKFDDVTRQLDQAQARAAGHRPNPEDVMLDQPDGSILSVAGENVVYINLGQSDHVVAGMTFEVYNQTEGLPKTSDGMATEEMPSGLGSIEVEHVDSRTSQCRVVKLQPAQHIHDGDLIANLVYDRHVKYNFYVYGQFNLSQVGKPNDGDRAKVEGLITQWGGRVQGEVNVDTDFVVMGAEPKVENFTPDDLTSDPFILQKQTQEKKELDAYNAVLTKAHDLHIPIVNQNRFLYFVGYYDNAQR